MIRVESKFPQTILLVGTFFIPLLADVLAQAPYYGMQELLYPWTVFAAVLVTLFFILLLGVTFTPDFLNNLGRGTARRVLMLVCLLVALVAFPFMGGTPPVPLRLVFGAFGVIFVVLMVRNPSSLLPFFLLAMAYSFLQRARFLNAVAIRPEFSDILPMIQLGAKNFLAGNAPYVFYDLPPRLPLSYLPITWLSYVPALVAGIDMRVTNLVAEFGIVCIVLSLLYPLRRYPAVNLAFGYAAFMFVLPTSMFWDSFTAHPIWWFWLVLSVRVLIARKFLVWALVMGITLASSQFALLVLPVFGLYVLRELGLLRAAFIFALLGGVAAGIMSPFALPDVQGFLYGPFFHFTDLKNYGQIIWEQSQRWQYILGFGGEAWRRGFPHLLGYVQGALILILAALYLFHYPNSVSNAVRVAAATLGGFLLFGAVVWHYYYQAAFYMVLVYLVIVTLETHRKDQKVAPI